MELFYSNQIFDTYLFLSDDESHHCIKVLRKNTGDEVQVIDGVGGLYSGILEIINKNKPVKVWIKSKKSFEAAHYQSGFHLAIAPTKSADRMEWLLEKTVELGIDSITFLQCEHSERTNLRLDRLEKIAVSALKQSQQYWLPKITMALSFTRFIEQFPKEAKGYIAHCYEGDKPELSSVFKKEPCYVLIGPEGDFSEAEVKKALAAGIQVVSLGQSRLRTETAGLFSCAFYRGFRTK